MIIGTLRLMVLLLALAAAGCKVAGDDARKPAADSVSAAPSPAPDSIAHGPKACDLLSAESIARVTQRAVTAGATTNDYMGDSQCKYANADGTPGGVMVALHERGDIDNYRKVPAARRLPPLAMAPSGIPGPHNSR